VPRDVTQQTVAVQSKNLNMNFCITCHKAKVLRQIVRPVITSKTE